MRPANVMPPTELRVVASYEELSKAAADRFAGLARERVKETGRFSAALSGGSTPKGFLQSLALPELANQVDWGRVHLFQVDERPVPPDHAESNYGMIRRVFLDRVPGAALNFHRLRGESDDLDAAAREYEKELSRVLQPQGGEASSLDLIFLGMGPDGHTASLFPHSPALSERARWVRPNYVAKLGLSRLTLTFPVLNSAGEIIFMVSGEDKASMIQRVLEGEKDPDEFPCQGIESAAGKVFWYLDKAAAARLRHAQGPPID